MSDYQEKASATGGAFLAALDDTEDSIEALASELTADELRKLLDAVDACKRSAGQIDFTLSEIIRQTPLTVVDLESRMVRETEELLDDAHALESAILSKEAVAARLKGPLLDVEDKLQDLACALFPSSAEGLKDANERATRFVREKRKLFELKANRLADRGKLDDARRRTVASTVERIVDAFQGTRSYLNDLALDRLDATEVVDGFQEQLQRLDEARELAKTARSDPQHDGFESIFKSAVSLADDTVKQLSRVQVPLFPKHGELEELAACVEQDLYEELSGPQKFALLNIASGMREIASHEGVRLVDPSFEPFVWRVYTDRVYLKAKDSLLSTVKSHDDFEEAPAGLHRFNEGSYKQNRFDKGNLQLSYQTRPGGVVDFDADVDLYRNPLAHFFGEVLVNHLSGSKTDQFVVRKILDERDVVPIGNFKITSLG